MSASAFPAPHTWLSLSPTPVEDAPFLGTVQMAKKDPNDDHQMCPQDFAQLFSEINRTSQQSCAWITTCLSPGNRNARCTIRDPNMKSSNRIPKSLLLQPKTWTRVTTCGIAISLKAKSSRASVGCVPKKGRWPSLRRKSTLASSFLFSSKATCGSSWRPEDNVRISPEKNLNQHLNIQGYCRVHKCPQYVFIFTLHHITHIVGQNATMEAWQLQL